MLAAESPPVAGARGGTTGVVRAGAGARGTGAEKGCRATSLSGPSLREAAAMGQRGHEAGGTGWGPKQAPGEEE